MAKQVSSTADFVRLQVDQRAKAMKLYGVDVTAGGNWTAGANGGYPATEKGYALVIVDFWTSAIHAAIYAAPDGLGAICKSLIGSADSESEMKNALAVCGSDLRGATKTDWLEKSGRALEQMYKAVNGAVNNRLIGLQNAQFWDNAKTIAAQLGSVSFRVTDQELWSAFKEGALDGVHNVGEAVNSAVEGAAGTIAGTIAAFVKGLGFVGVAFAILAILVFKSKLI